MAMKFCPDCGGLLKIRVSKGVDFVVCERCGYFKEGTIILNTEEKFEEKKEVGKGAVSGDNIFATYKNKCKKCRYENAQIIDMGIFISDEDNLILLKCGRCGYSERIGRRTG